MTKIQRAAMQQALEFCEELQGGCTDSDDGTVEAITVWCPEVIEALRAALAEPEPEPVEAMSDKKVAAMQQALKALEKCKAALAEELAAWDIDPPLRHVLEAANSCGPSIAALRAALAEPEPPIWQTLAEIGASAPAGTWDAPVATPPARQPLTTDQIVKLWNEAIANGAILGLSDTALFARAVEHAHGIKEAK